MPIQQYVPTFGRLRITSRIDYGLIFKQLSRISRSQFVFKGVSVFETEPYLRYHALTPHHQAKHSSFDVAFCGALGDSRHLRMTSTSDGIGEQLWCRSHYWNDQGMLMQIYLNSGSCRRDWDVWFRLSCIARDCVEPEQWRRCWETAASSFGLAELIYPVDVNGLMMPDWRPETPRVRDQNRSIDSNGFEVLAGFDPEFVRCYLTRLFPNGNPQASQTLERGLAKLIGLWKTQPDVETTVRLPTSIPDDFWPLQRELIVWDRIALWPFTGEIKDMLPLTLTPPEGEVVAVPCFGVWPAAKTSAMLFQVPLEVCRVHTSSDLWIEFQVHDAAWLQKFADATGLPVEQWVGDHVSRWGWYAPVQSGDHSIAIHPSPGSKAIEVPASKPATKKSSATKSTKKKSVKKK